MRFFVSTTNMLVSISLLSTNLSSFHISVPNPSSPEIQRNDHDNPIPENAKNDRTAESETIEFVLKYW